MGNFLGLLIVNSNDIIFSCCRKTTTCWIIVYSHNIVSFFVSMKDFFTSFRSILIKMSICVGNEKYCCSATICFIHWSPPQSIYWSWLFCSCVDLGDLIISSQIENPDVPITISTCGHCILMIKANNHQLRLLLDDCLHQDLILQRDPLDNSLWSEKYLCDALGFFGFI